MCRGHGAVRARGGRVAWSPASSSPGSSCRWSAGRASWPRRPARTSRTSPSALVQPLLPQQTKIVAADGTTSWRRSTPRTASTSAAPPDQPAAAEGRRRDRGLPVLRAQRHRPARPGPGAGVQRPGRRGPGRLDPHPAVRQERPAAHRDQRRRSAPTRPPAPRPASCARCGWPWGWRRSGPRTRSCRATSTSPTSATGRTAPRRPRERYFGVHASQLTLPQAATLAGLVQSPVSYDPITNPTLSQKRRNVVLERMSQQGVISDGRLRQGGRPRRSRPTLNPSRRPTAARTSIAPYFCNYVLKYHQEQPVLREDGGRPGRLPRPGGYTIRTTLDVKAAGVRAADARQEGADHRQARCRGLGGPAGHRQHPGDGPEPHLGHGKGNQYTTYNYNVDRRTSRTRPASDQLQRRRLPDRVDVQAVRARGRPASRSIPVNTRIHAPGRRQTSRTRASRTAQGHDVSARTPVCNAEGGSGTLRPAHRHLGLGQHLLRRSSSSRPACARRRRSPQSMGVARADGGTLPVPSLTLGANPVAPLHMAEAYATFAAHGMHCTAAPILSITDRDREAVAVPPHGVQAGHRPRDRRRRHAILNGVIDGPAPAHRHREARTGRPPARPAPPTTTSTCGSAASPRSSPRPSGSATRPAPASARTGRCGTSRSASTHYAPAFGYNLPGPVWKTS